MLRRLTNTAPIFLLTWSSCCRENLLCFMHYGLSGNTMKSKKNTSKFSENLSRCSCSTVAIFDWIVFVAWLTDERCLALFPVGIIVKDPQHRESSTRCKQNLNLRRTWVQALLNEVCSSDNHDTTAPLTTNQ